LNKDVLSLLEDGQLGVSKYRKMVSYLANEVLDGSASAADAQIEGCRSKGEPTQKKALYA
jgi:hypothetical protein